MKAIDHVVQLKRWEEHGHLVSLIEFTGPLRLAFIRLGGQFELGVLTNDSGDWDIRRFHELADAEAAYSRVVRELAADAAEQS